MSPLSAVVRQAPSRQRRVGWPLLLAFIIVVVAGCGGTLNAAVAAYHHADYPHAAREFREASVEGFPADDAARYHLYCGLNHFALGNARLAIVHLTYARATLDADANYFSLDERARLWSAWRSLGRMPGQALVE